MKTYRMLCDDVEEWRGAAHDVEHAEEKCFYDEPPSRFALYTLQHWGEKQITRSIRGKGWITDYRNETLTSY